MSASVTELGGRHTLRSRTGWCWVCGEVVIADSVGRGELHLVNPATRQNAAVAAVLPGALIAGHAVAQRYPGPTMVRSLWDSC